MGLLGNFDFLPEDQQKREAARAGLLQFGASLMGGTGNFGQILGNGITAGAQGYHGTLAQQQQKALRDLQTKQLGLENQKLQAGIDEPMELAKIAAGAGGGLRPIGAPSAAGGIAPVSSLPQVGQVKAAPAPAPVASETKPVDQYQYYLGLSQAYSSAGKMTAAKTAMEMADKLKPKLKEQQARTVDGKRVLANVYDDGRTEQVQGFAPDLEKLHFADSGAGIDGLDQFSGKVVSTIKKTVSPGDALSAATQRRGQDITARGQSMTDARARDNINLSRGQIVQTDEGPQLVDVRAGTAHPVIGTDGQPIRPKLKSLPAPIQKALLENDAALRKVDMALKAVSSYPAAFGAKNYLGDTIRQRSDPDGIKPRALVADIGSLKLHDRSGAAVTAAETPRLKPFIPDARDDAETVRQKLELFQQEYQAIQSDINDTYTREQGYREPAQPKSVKDLPKKAPAAGVPRDIDALMKKYGGK